MTPDVRAALFGSRLRIAGTVVGALVLLAVLAVVLGLVGVPTVDGVENRFGPVNDSTTVIVTDLTVDNPNPVGSGAADVSAEYTVAMNGIAIAEGAKSDVRVGPGTSTVRTRTLMDNERIPEWWVTHVRNDERTTLRVNATLSSGALGRSYRVQTTKDVETDIIGQFNSEETRPIDADQPAVEDPVLYVNETSAEWGAVSESETPIDMGMTLYNPKATDYVVTEVRYTIYMNDVTVGEGSTDRTYRIPAGGTREVGLTTAILNERLDEWWVTHLENDQVTDLRIEFAAELDTGVTTITLPLSELTYRKEVETDIFGTKKATAADGNATDGGEDDASEERTDDGAAAGEDTTAGGETTTTTGGATTTTAGDDTTSDDGTSTTTDDGGLLPDVERAADRPSIRGFYVDP